MDVSSYVNKRGRRSLQVRLDVSEAQAIAEGADLAALVEAVRRELAALDSQANATLQHTSDGGLAEELDSLLPTEHGEVDR